MPGLEHFHCRDVLLGGQIVERVAVEYSSCPNVIVKNHHEILVRLVLYSNYSQR